jgi:addiction module RelE/StbE family toxin
MKVFWSDLAIDKVTEIAEYINRDNPQATEKWVAAIFDRVKQLESFPKSGRRVPEVNRSNIREIFFGNYRIIYKMETDQIVILTVCHGKQILPVDEIEE